jgi:hypothetical protein
METQQTIERQRLDGDGAAWRRWGPYVSSRAWGTVREDYSAEGDAWDYFPHDHARFRAYRWNEDGLGGICDERQILCFALALWNGKDPVLKERLFGLTNSEGNHGEDVKEYFYSLDSTPTHSYLSMLYKYPQAAYPYEDLVVSNARRTRDDFEYELIDTGVFQDDRYFDVLIEYAKAAPNDILIRLSAVNRGPDAASLHLLPTLWFRNTWSWDVDSLRPSLSRHGSDQSVRSIRAEHPDLGVYQLHCEGSDDLLLTENDSNLERLYGVANPSPYVKDAFHEYVVNGRPEAVNPEGTGTKAAALYNRVLASGETLTLRLRLVEGGGPAPSLDFDHVFEERKHEADAFYASFQPTQLDDDQQRVQRQALAGMLWNKQYYRYDVIRWLKGDPTEPPPPPLRQKGRNHQWFNLYAADVISMPDAWEYPWFAGWDLAFHCIPLALIDIDLAKAQIELLLEDRFLHPNGAIPAYEWNFSDVNPPVIAWSAIRVAQMEERQRGTVDIAYLERVFHKLMLNFVWWVNRKDSEDRNVFEGGFLGMDNIGIFDRSAPLPGGFELEQSDATGWMGVFCQGMLTMALELARHDHAYEDIAVKFLEHFLYIAGAIHNLGGEGIPLWDDTDQFFYDVVRLPDGTYQQLRVRTLVGLTPLFAAVTLQERAEPLFPTFRRRAFEFVARRPDLAALIPISQFREAGAGNRYLLTLVSESQLRGILKCMLDPDEFLSDFGIRSISRFYRDHPYSMQLGGTTYTIEYEPAESRTGMFGGNSNWRGPIWFPMNYMLIDALRRFHQFYGDDFKVECPTGSGDFMNLGAVADELSRRLIRIFTRDEAGNRPFNGSVERFQSDPQWRDLLLFNEYFHGDNGAGIGANHQTGWTGLVANLIQQQGERITAGASPATQPQSGA